MTPAAQLWEARDQLHRASLPADRNHRHLQHGGVRASPSSPPSIAATDKAMLNTPTKSDADAVINYLRGDRSLEGSTYRTRGHLLGDIVSAEPVFVAGAIATYADTGYNAFASSIASRQKSHLPGRQRRHAACLQRQHRRRDVGVRAARRRIRGSTPSPIPCIRTSSPWTAPRPWGMSTSTAPRRVSGGPTGRPSWWAGWPRAARASMRSTSPIRPQRQRERGPRRRR